MSEETTNKACPTDLFNPFSIMEPDFSRSSGGGGPNFEFAFNSVNFSDRVLRIEVVADPPEIKAGSGGCSSLADWARQRKRRREELQKEKGYHLGFVYSFYNILQKNQPLVVAIVGIASVKV
jgi:hypothetical protein